MRTKSKSRKSLKSNCVHKLRQMRQSFCESLCFVKVANSLRLNAWALRRPTMQQLETRTVLTLDTGLEVSYLMDGTLLDSSVHGNHAIVDSPSNAAVPTLNRFGVVNRSLDFDGINDYARANASLTDPALNDGLTISVFVKADSIGYGGQNRIRPIVFKQKPDARSFVPQFMLALDGRSGTGRALFMLASTVALPGETANDGRVGVESNIGLADNQWYHVAATFDKPTQLMRLYVNGQLVGATSHANFPTIASSLPVTIGTSSYGDMFDGVIDNLRIYNRALSAEEVQLIGATGNPPQVSIDGPTSGRIGASLTFTGTASDPDPLDASQLSLAWNVHSGANLIATGVGTSATFVPRVYGNYVVEFQATDSEGLTATQSVQTSVLLTDIPSFSPLGSISVGSTPYEVISSDMNRDGLMDIVTSDYASNSISLSFGQGDGSFANAVAYSMGQGPIGLVVADLNGDGNNDVITAGLGDGSLTARFGSSNGTLGPASVVGAAGGHIKLRVADFNNDGYLDLAAMHVHGQVSVWLNNGAGQFGGLFWWSYTGNLANDLVVTDLDDDGDSDLVVSLWSGTSDIKAYLNNGSGTFAFYSSFPNGRQAGNLAIADLNQDGKEDLIATNAGDSSVNVYLRTGVGAFGIATRYTTGDQQGGGVQVADMNGDQIPDLVVANWAFNVGTGNGDVSILAGNGDGTFVNQVRYPAGDDINGLALADVNGDGAKEVLAVNRLSNGTVTVLRNTLAAAYASTRVSLQTPATAKTDVPFTVGVSAIDPSGQTLTSFNGTIHFSSSDPLATLPSDTAYSNSDLGQRQFTITFRTPGPHRLTAHLVGTDGIQNSQILPVIVPAAPVITDLDATTPGSRVRALMSHWYTGDIDARDSVTVNAIDGTLVGSASAGVPGKVGGAFSLAGNGDAVYMNYAPSLTAEAGSFTTELWIKTSASGPSTLAEHYECGGGCGPGASPSWGMGITETGKFFGGLRDVNGTSQYLEAGLINDNQFHHVAMVRDTVNSIFAIYVDGAVVASSPLVVWGQIYDGDGENDPITLGHHRPPNASPGDSNYAAGLYDEFRTYKRALAAEEIAARFVGADLLTVVHQPLTLQATASLSSGSNGPLTYSWDFGDGSSQQSGIDLATVQHSFNTVGVQTVTLQVIDGDGRVATRSVAVYVYGNPNRDIGPVADASPVQNQVLENAAIGTLVGVTALAVDPDSGDSVTYTLTDSAGGRLAIDPVTGIVSVAGAIDYEQNSTLSMAVRATSTDGSFSTALFSIVVMDVIEGITFEGTAGNDTLKFWPAPTAGEYYFKRNAEPNLLFTANSNIIVNGNGGVDTLIIEGTNGANQFDLFADKITFNTISFYANQIATRQVNALGSGDTVRYFGGAANVNGGSAVDKLVAMEPSNHTWTITGVNSGNLDGQVFFTSVESLIGNTGVDVFNIGAAASLSSIVDGLGGNDVIDYSAVQTSISTNLQSGSSTKTGGIRNIEQIVGSAAVDTLILSNTGNTVDVTGASIGSLNSGLVFAGYENITGGSGVDNFIIGTQGQILGNLNGGGGNDTLQYLANDNLQINLATNTASRVGGTVLSIQQFVLGAGNDTVIGRSTASTWAVAGANTVTTSGVSVTNVENLVGGSDLDTLTGPVAGSVWEVTSSNAGVLGGLAWNGFENVTGGSGDDTFLFRPNAAITGTLNGGSGADLLDFSSFGQSVTLDLANLSATVPSSTIVGRFLSLTTVKGSAGLDTIIGANNTNTWRVTDEGGNVDGLVFQAFETWQGGTAADTLIGLNANNQWQVTSSNAGSIGSTQFSAFENLTGNSLADTFTFIGSGSLSGTVNGSSGIDTLDFSNALSAIVVSLAANSISSVGGFVAVEQLVGSVNQDTVIGADTANTWTIKANNTVNVRSLDFTGFESLVGGLADDTFRPLEGTSFLGAIEGGGGDGSDRLDYAAFTTNVSVNLSAGNATGLEQVLGIENITGGLGNDTLIGDSQPNVLNGGSGDDILLGMAGNDTINGGNGRDMVFGGTGSDLLHGNNGDDLLIGGSAVYINEGGGSVDQVALDALMLEWRRTDSTYSQRVARIRGSTAGGLNGSYYLNSLTIEDDLAIDDLWGDANTDWFWAGSGDTLHSTSGEEVN